MAKHKDVLSTTEILKYLHRLGYFGDVKFAAIANITGARLRGALQHYQKFHGLRPLGTVTVPTITTMKRRRCGLPDFEIRASEEPCAWPMTRVYYHTALDLPGITRREAIEAYDIACGQWAAVCGLKLVRAVSAKRANILAKSGRGRADGLDNIGGTLAWSEMPCEATWATQLQQMYDQAEDWTVAMAIAVSCHEIGHALGLPHLPKGNLMAPHFDQDVSKPQPGDIREIRLRYPRAA